MAERYGSVPDLIWASFFNSTTQAGGIKNGNLEMFVRIQQGRALQTPEVRKMRREGAVCKSRVKIFTFLDLSIKYLNQ